MIPGGNLLQTALGMIGNQTVAYRAFAGKSTNAAGVVVSTWADPVPLVGSVQAVPNVLLQQLGLDWSKDYVTFYCSREFSDPSRDRTGDRFDYGGAVYEVQSPTPWNAQDGWSSVLCVRVANA